MTEELHSVPVALVDTPIAALVVQGCRVTMLFAGRWPMTEAMIGQLPYHAPFESITPVARFATSQVDWVLGSVDGRLVRVDWDADTDWDYRLEPPEREAAMERSRRVSAIVHSLPVIVTPPEEPTR